MNSTTDGGAPDGVVWDMETGVMITGTGVPALSPRAAALDMRMGASASMANDDGDNRRGLMGLLMDEIAAQAGDRTGPTATTIEVGEARLTVSAAGWPLIHPDAGEPPAAPALKDAVAVLAEWARDELDPVIDAFMDMTLSHRATLVENLLLTIDTDDDHRANVHAVLRFVDDGLALDGESATLSIRIQSALLED
ncbi:MAG: hypothetical protein AAFU77_05830 [Myxococcota bacterium]